MSKTKTVYVCQSCGAQSPKWVGKCNTCGEWNTVLEEIVTERKTGSPQQSKEHIRPLLLSEIDLDQQERIITGNTEFDRVTGGGLVPGGMILLGGEPGIGKSTLVLQIALKLAHLKVLYISGEESLQQLKMRANRLNGKPVQGLSSAGPLVASASGVTGDRSGCQKVVEGTGGTIPQYPLNQSLQLQVARRGDFTLTQFG